MEGLTITFIPREKQKSEYDWADIVFNGCNVGKARCLIEGYNFTIYTINVYPEYQGNGYGREFVERAKHKYRKVIADTVRYTSTGFWTKVGFVRMGETANWIYETPHF